MRIQDDFLRDAAHGRRAGHGQRFGQPDRLHLQFQRTLMIAAGTNCELIAQKLQAPGLQVRTRRAQLDGLLRFVDRPRVLPGGGQNLRAREAELGVLGLQARGFVGGPQRLVLLSQPREQHGPQPVGAAIFVVQFQGHVDVAAAQRVIAGQASFGPQREGLRVDGLENDLRDGGLLHARDEREDHAAFGKDQADGLAGIVVHRGGLGDVELQLGGDFLRREVMLQLHH